MYPRFVGLGCLIGSLALALCVGIDTVGINQMCRVVGMALLAAVPTVYFVFMIHTKKWWPF